MLPQSSHLASLGFPYTSTIQSSYGRKRTHHSQRCRLTTSNCDGWKITTLGTKSLLKKVTIQRTKSGGYHYVYRCTKIEGNQKLAQRNGNEEELKNGEKVKVLIETRGEGGQIAVYPSPGYEMIQGSWLTIPSITEDERDILIETARTFNEYMEEVKTYTKVEKIKVPGITPWEDYDNRGDVIGLLQSHGWRITTLGTKSLPTYPRYQIH